MKYFKIIIMSTLFGILLVACSNKEDHSHHDHSDMDIDQKSELVREGVINVESIDKNNDDKIFECPMDWNVLDDKDGNCPVCGMKLKEFSIAAIKENLEKYGYEYEK